MKVIEIKKTTIIYVAIILAMLCYIVLSSRTTTPDKYGEYKNQIDSLSRVINTLELEQLKQDSLIDIYVKQIGQLDNQIVDQKDKIQTIRQQYGEQINNIRNLNSTELDSFFTNRYSNQDDSIR